MKNDQGASIGATTGAWLALLALTAVSFVAGAARSAGGETGWALFGLAFVKLVVIAAVFMELGFGRRRALGIAIAVFAVTTVLVALSLPRG